MMNSDLKSRNTDNIARENNTSMQNDQYSTITRARNTSQMYTTFKNENQSFLQRSTKRSTRSP